MKTKAPNQTKLGRPRKFNEDQAVEAAMHVFWKKGYEGASLHDLTKAMGIDRKSMYLVLGDKEALFRKALTRYSALQLSYLPSALEKHTLLEFINESFEAAILFYTDKSHPETCMSLHCFAVGDEAQPIRKVLIDWRKWVFHEYRKRFERARRDGELPKHIQPMWFARYFAAFMAGLAVQASDGATLRELKQVISLFRETMPIYETGTKGSVSRDSQQRTNPRECDDARVGMAESPDETLRT